MASADTEKIDFIGIAPDDYCVLTIADNRDWTEADDHVTWLKAKLNTYIDFIRSGEIERSYPQGKDKELKILLALREPPPPVAVAFLTEAKATILALGFEFSWQVFNAG